MRFSSVSGAHYGTCAIIPGLERQTKAISGDAIIFLGRKDEPKVAVLASTEVALDGRRVRHQELVCILDGGVVQLSHVIGE